MSADRLRRRRRDRRADHHSLGDPTDAITAPRHFDHFGEIVQAAGRFELDSETPGLRAVAERADSSAGTMFEQGGAGKARLVVRGEELT